MNQHMQEKSDHEFQSDIFNWHTDVQLEKKTSFINTETFIDKKWTIMWHMETVIDGRQTTMIHMETVID